jgi:hypothetical protein
MKKREQKNIQHACLAQVVRDGGWKIATIFRYSAIPSHCEMFRGTASMLTLTTHCQ